MAFLDKIMFWKKKDDFGDLGGIGAGLGKDNLAFGDNFNAGAGQFGQQGFGDPGLGQGAGTDFSQQQGFGAGSGNYGQPQNQGYPQSSIQSFGPSPYQQSQRYDPQTEIASKNIEIISSKLDALRASLDSINQRLENLEAIARGDEEPSRRRRYY